MTYKTKTQEILELSCPYHNQHQGNRRRLLFVCSAGLLRSPTGAAVAIARGYNARSCGTGNYALIQLSANLIYWADRIYFMHPENYQAAMALVQDQEDLIHEINCKHSILGIEDRYNYMDPELTSIFHDMLGSAYN